MAEKCRHIQQDYRMFMFYFKCCWSTCGDLASCTDREWFLHFFHTFVTMDISVKITSTRKQEKRLIK